MGINKNNRTIIAYLPAFSFTLTYIIYQYLTSGISANASPMQILPVIIYSFLILIGCSFIARKVLKDNYKAGLAVWFAAEILLFSEKYFIVSMLISSILILLWAGILFLRKKKFRLDHISFLLATLGFSFTIGLLVKNVPWSLYLWQIPVMRESPSSSIIVPILPPDIYYIIIDGYVRSDVLKEFYGFDNSDFTTYLLDNNFIIPENNHSNYSTTTLSIGSTLNMQYIQTIMPDVEGLPIGWPMIPIIKDNLVKAMLEEVGYKSVAVAVDWELTDIDNADIYLKPLPIQINDFEKFLFQSSPLKIFSSVIEKFMLLKSYPSHGKTVNFAFKALSEIPNIAGPKFVFTHITSPHPPFVFDMDGQPVLPSYNFSMNDGNEFPGSREQYKNGYVNQLQYINRQLKNAIDSILEKSDNPPIIIVLSDHGSKMLTNFSLSENSCIRERNSNFAAFYLPGLDDDAMPSDITPVNVFRVIFDQYFGTEFGMLDNEYYFSNNAFQFEDVESRINEVCTFPP